MKLHKVISRLKPEIFQIGEFHVAKISRLQAVSELHRMRVDGIVVDSELLLKEVLKDDNLYLRPLFYLGKTARQCDGQVASVTDPQIRARLEVLLPALKEYEEMGLPDENKDRLLVKIFRYLISRKQSLNAFNSRLSSIGYAYSLVEDMSIESDPLHIIKHLNECAHQAYFTKQVVDKINICYDCQGSYLNFGECCTKCNSLDLKSEELVHHFRCAYVGPQSDFVKNEKLICPKCDHQLKHIGIDYDKPSEIHTCRSCNHSSQETKMKAKCVDCRKENELDQLVTIEISDYKITEKARALASQSNKVNSFKPMVENEHSVLVNIGAFQLIKSHEKRKDKRPEIDSFHMVISVDNNLLSQLNSGLQLSLLEELSTIIKPYLLDNDLLSIDTTNNINGLLIDYDENGIPELIDVLNYNLNKMLNDNGWGNNELITISINSIRS